MGAWGIKTFENDDSSDWLYDLEESDDLSVLESALNEAEQDYIEAPEGCNILAAAEVILGLQGKGRELPENAQEWIEKNKGLNVSTLVTVAIKAVDAVLSDKSELFELWQDAEEDFENWKSDVESIKAALSVS